MKWQFSAGWLAVVLTVTLCSATSRAALKVAADNSNATLGETVAVRATGVPEGVAVDWSSTWELRLVSSTGSTAQFTAAVPGAGIVSAAAGGEWGTAHIAVTPPVGALRPVIPGAGREGLGGNFATGDLKKMQSLLERYRDELGKAGLHDQFAPQTVSVEEQGVKLPANQAAQLGTITEKFFHELGDAQFSLRDLQRYKNAFQGAASGGTPLFPGGTDWGRTFQGTERALMLGRANLVQQLWKETLIETLRENPRAGIFGEIDIGSWVKLQLGGLGFGADIDLSSVALDSESALNRFVRDRFEKKLRAHTSLDMIQADALLTAHGQATPDVFIGEWGKTFAELDMLKRSKWKLLRPKIVDGVVVDVISDERPGSQLFWEVAFQNGKEVKFPKMDLDKEPMLSLEMLRHGIHDIERGPYSRGQQLIKMLKYAERSYFMNKKAVAESQWNPYTENDPKFAEAADAVIKNKDDPAAVDRLLAELNGGEITEANIDVVTEKLMARAKIAMHDNAAHALAFRLKTIAGIDNEDARRQAAEKMWQDLDTELKAFEHGVEKPQLMVDALELTKAVAEGKVSPEELEQKSSALEKLLSDSFKLSTEVIQRTWMGDTYAKLRGYLGKKMRWTNQQIEAFVTASRQKFPNGAKVHDAVMRFNDRMARTVPGQGLLDAADFADGAFAVYEAYLSSADENEALWNAGLTMGRMGAQMKFPSLGIPLAIYDSCREGSPKPLGMAVTFMYFPWIGQGYMVSQQLQRLDTTMRDGEFYSALGKIMDVTDFNTDGQITRFRLMNKMTIFNNGKPTEIDSADVNPPGDRKRIVAIFSEAESPFYVSPNFRYFSSLVPKQNDLFGLYETKLQNLRRFFPYSEDVSYMTLMLENFRATKPKTLDDTQAAQRNAILDKMEEDLQKAVWVAMADALESAVKESKRPELEEKIKKLEDELSLGDDALGSGKGLRSMIAWEIRQNSSWFKGENVYAISLIYDKYQKAYDRVLAIRLAITMDIWFTQFGADVSAAQKRPLKIFFQGTDYGAPRLTGNPEKDVALAEAALAAHKKRAAQTMEDLAKALGRAVDPTKDQEYLRALGQLALEWEHLIDEIPDRAPAGAGTAMLDAVIARGKAYNDYLKTIGEIAVPPLVIEGPATAKIGEAFKLTAVTKGLTPEQLKNFSFNWQDPSYKLLPDHTPIITTKAEKAGQVRYIAAMIKKTDKGEQSVASAVHKMEILPNGLLPITLSGPPPTLPLGTKTTIYSNIEGDNVPSDRLRYEWSGGLGSQSYLEYNPTKPGANTLTLTAYLKTGTMEQKYAEGSIKISVIDTRLQLPEAVNATDFFSVSVKVPAEFADRVAGFQWSGAAVLDEATGQWSNWGYTSKSPSVKMQFGFRPPSSNPAEKISPSTIAVTLVDAAGKMLVVFNGELLVRPVAFNGVSTDAWNGGAWAEGVSLKHKGIHGGAGQGQSGAWGPPAAEASMEVKITGANELQKPGAIQAALQAKADSWKGKIMAFSVGDFTGFVVESPAGSFSPGFIGAEGYQSSGGGRYASGYVVKGNCALAITLSANTAGAPGYNTDAGERVERDRAWQLAKLDQLLAEMKGIAAGLKLTPDAKFQKTPYKGPALDGSDDIAPLSVAVAGPAIVRFGQMGDVNATVTGGRPPYKYEWSGDHGGDGAKVTVLPTKAGEQKLLLTVTSADNQKASATHTYTVEKVTATITGLESPVVFGTERKISITTNVDPKTLRVIWQAEPNVTFNPPTSDDGATTVRFDRIPEKGLKIWAQLAHASDGGTIGETQQVTVKVLAPKFSISFEPAAAKIGQEVTARITVTPAPIDPALLSFQWSEPASSVRRELDHAATAITFTPRDTKPISLLARGIVPTVAERVGEVSAKFTATGFKLSAKVVEPGTRPMIWKEGVGLVPVARGSYAGDEQVTVEAKFEGDQPQGEIRWSWAANEGTSVSNPVSQSPQLSRSETGTASATVTARDKNEVTLGTATVSFNVNVTAEAVKQALEPRVTLKTDKRTLKTGETVRLTADVRGGKAPYTYDWRGANSGDTGPSVTLKPTEPEKISVEVTVTDSAGKTADASMDLDVQLSARDKARQDAEQAVARAQELATQGDFDGAQRLIETARRSDAAIAAPVAREIAQLAKAEAQDAEQKRDFATAGKLFTIAVKLDPSDIEAARGANNAPVYAKNLAQVVSWQRDVGQYLQSGLLARAGDRLAELKNLESILPGPLSAETQALEQRYEADLAAYRAEMSAFKKRVAKDFSDDRLAEIKVQIEERRKQPLLPEDETWADVALKTIAEKETRRAAAETAAAAAATAVANPPTPPAVSAPPAVVETKPVTALTGTKPSTTTATGTATGPLTPLAGEWKVSFNNFPGTLKITGTTATLDLGDGPEKLTQVRIDSSGTVSFTRPLGKFGAGNQQVYTGRLTRDGHAEGTFDCTISGPGYKWSIDRTARAATTAATTAAAPAPAVIPAPATKPLSVFNNWNTGGVGNGPTAPTVFTLDRPLRVSYVNSYHYNFGRGTKAGTLALQHSDGSLYGPWRVKGTNASGAPDGLWECEPGVVLKPGRYTVVDSEPATWSQNGQSGGSGFVEVRGLWADARDITAPVTPRSTTPTTLKTPAGVLVDIAAAKEPWMSEWTLTATSGDLANGGPVGFFAQGKRGDATPPAGRTGLLYIHPPTQGAPAKLERQVHLGRAPVLHLTVAGNSPTGGTAGDWQLVIRVNGTAVGAARNIDGAAGWLDLTYDLSAFANRDSMVVIEAHPTGWFFEYVFIDTIALTDGTARTTAKTPVATPPAASTAASTTGKFVTATYENHAAQNVHIFVEGRDTFDPRNRVTPGEKRSVKLDLPANGRLKFVAGRNGQVLARATWNGDPDDTSRFPVVRFTEDGGPTLLVTTGLR